jgi:putative ABC transport system substrate-binding protein
MRPARLGVTNGTILDPKCDILFIPDGVLGAGEAMRRREFITLLGGAAAVWPVAAHPQQQRIAQIGFLGAGTAAGYAKDFEAFGSGLRDFGYVEGKSIIVYSRWAGGDYDLLTALATELLALDVAVLVTHGTPGTNAAKNVTSTIPIVMAVSGDAEKTGLVHSLARPGGNVTGLTYFASEQTSKRLEVLKEVIPSLGRVAFLFNPENPIAGLELEGIESAAQSLKIEFRAVEVRSAGDLNEAFSLIVKAGCNAVEYAQDGMLASNVSIIAAAALYNRLPAVGDAHFASAGGLLGFGPNLREMFRRAAYFVDRLLKGEKAADLPVERPSKFELAINLKTARALDLTVPGAMLARADEVIE